MSRLPTFAVAAPRVGAPGHPQDQTAEIDRIFAWATSEGSGCVVAVSQHGKMVVNRAYGLADLERGVPLSTDSVFDVASIRKQFVAAAILLLVEDERLSLSDDVRKFIPELPERRRGALFSTAADLVGTPSSEDDDGAVPSRRSWEGRSTRLQQSGAAQDPVHASERPRPVAPEVNWSVESRDC